MNSTHISNENNAEIKFLSRLRNRSKNTDESLHQNFTDNFKVCISECPNSTLEKKSHPKKIFKVIHQKKLIKPKDIFQSTKSIKEVKFHKKTGDKIYSKQKKSKKKVLNVLRKEDQVLDYDIFLELMNSLEKETSATSSLTPGGNSSENTLSNILKNNINYEEISYPPPSEKIKKIKLIKIKLNLKKINKSKKLNSKRTLIKNIPKENKVKWFIYIKKFSEYY
jgi:hypothetical protein